MAVREYPTDSGPADYLLFVDRQAAGVIEAKRDSAGENLTVTECQTERYATANLKWRQDDRPLRFLFEATVPTPLPSFTRLTACSLNSAVYSAFGIFCIIVSSVTVILRHPWKTKFRGNLTPHHPPAVAPRAIQRR